MMFHVVYASPNMMDADIEATDVAVGQRGDLLFLDAENSVQRNIAAGQWIEWMAIPEKAL